MTLPKTGGTPRVLADAYLSANALAMPPRARGAGARAPAGGEPLG
ncbi:MULTISPECIES: hypothetical protein [Myxococcaceae]|nr:MULTISPECIES: hypothetical protein [Myxococcaceae]